jgi:hypothetical protein
MNVLRTLFFSTAAIFIVTASAGAQATPRTKGVNLGIALNGSAIKLDDEDYGQSDTESGAGLSLQAGYNFTPNIGIFLGVTGANIQAQGGGSYGLGHGDLGVRVSLGSSAVVPYIEAAYTGLNAQGTIDGDDIEFQGFGGTGTLGLNFFFSQRTALDINFKYTKGEFNTFKVNGDGITSGDGVGVATGRFNLGIAFYPSAGKVQTALLR